MQDLTQSGTITARFGTPPAFVAINPGGTAAAPVWQVINYITRETVTISAAEGTAGTVASYAAHCARSVVTVGGVTGGILNDAIAAARALEGSGSVTAFLGPTPAYTQMVELLAVTAGGTQWLYAARPAGSGISIFEVGAGGALVARGTVADSAGTYAAGVTAMVAVPAGGTTYLYTASETEHGLTAFAIGAGGALTAVDRDGPAEEVPVQGLSALEAVTVGGTTFLVAAAAGSSSLSVFRVEADGTAVLVDHLIDDLGTRFDGAVVLDALVVGGRAFIAVAGADDGISLFTLDPGGALIHLCTVADAAGSSLQNLSALRLAPVGDEVQLLAASSVEAGLTVMRVDLSAAGPLLSGTAGTLTGTAGADMLVHGAGAGLVDGAGGDDILIDGAGQDSLRGGAGRDTFVLAYDQLRDVILDFDPAQDRIDLSRWHFLRSAAQLAIEVTGSGAILRYLGETLEIVTANGQPLSAAEVAALAVVPATRLHLGAVPGPPPPEGEVRSGAAGNDTFMGGNGNDSLYGNGGDDVIAGRGGADLFFGGAGWDTVTYIHDTARIILNLSVPGENSFVAFGDAFSSIEAFVGTNFGDILRGDAVANHLSGAGGADLLEGFGGADSLFGGDGSDTLRGMDGDDRLEGGAGIDLFSGGLGWDVVSYAGETAALVVDLAGGAQTGAAAGEAWDGIEGWWLGSGDDGFRGGAAGEEARGGGGADLLEGFDGADSLRGDEGNDTLGGGTGHDTLQGGAGEDEIAAGDGDDALWGDEGADNMGGGSGRDSLHGGEGADTLGAGPGDDWLWGDAGDDYLSGGPENDRLFGGDGNDGFSGSFGADLIEGGAGNDNLGGGAGKDTLRGDDGQDTLGGGDGDDWQDGGTGDDFIAAGAGHDTLFGGEGADRLVPGVGNDVMWGGTGADTFVFSGWAGAETDRIGDFDDGIDRINAQGVPGASAAARFAALAPAEVWIDGVAHVQFGLNGQTVLVAGMTLAQFGTDDFIFT
jgi:Ca2+-binding RTX toxin-like protein